MAFQRAGRMLKNKESRNENIFKRDIIDLTKLEGDDNSSENESTKTNQEKESANQDNQDNENMDLIKAETQ